MDGVWFLVFGYVDSLHELLKLRLLSSFFRDSLLNEKRFALLLHCDAVDLCLDFSPLSPLDRMLRIFHREKAVETNLKLKTVASETNFAVQGPCRHLILAGRHSLVVLDRSWFIGDLFGNPIPHLIESLPREAPMRLPFVVLRDTFIIVSICGFVYAIDTSGSIEAANILCRADHDSERLYGFQNRIAYCTGKSNVSVFEFSEHPPFGFHFELLCNLQLEGVVGLCKEGLVVENRVYDLRNGKYLEFAASQAQKHSVCIFEEKEGNVVAFGQEDAFVIAQQAKIVFQSFGRAVISTHEGKMKLVSLF